MAASTEIFLLLFSNFHLFEEFPEAEFTTDAAEILPVIIMTLKNMEREQPSEFVTMPIVSYQVEVTRTVYFVHIFAFHVTVQKFWFGFWLKWWNVTMFSQTALG